jgi:hypothetical protein
VFWAGSVLFVLGFCDLSFLETETPAAFFSQIRESNVLSLELVK